jgi:pimeloyl-ACP methyl ester carboxylesterase
VPQIAKYYLDGMEPVADSLPASATGSRSTPLQRAFIRELLISQDPLGYVALCTAIRTAKDPDLAAISVPVLLITGEEDKSATREGCNFILQNLKSTVKKLEVLDGVGHWQSIEAPVEVGKLIVDFCGQIR